MTKTIYVVTPSFNAEETIERTILSVISQSGDFKIRYHIQDGGSKDGTVDIIEKWKKKLKLNQFNAQCHGIHMTYASEKDHGMYDALVKGFANTNAYPDDFMTWINADDILMQGALALASALGRQFKKEQISWFGGAVCIISNDFVKQSFDRPTTQEVIRSGLCDGHHWDFIQQEGTFFRNWLWRAVDPAKSISKMKLAGDWNLWRLMAERAAFYQVNWALGGFRVSDKQLSVSQRDRYFEEINSILSKEKRRELMYDLFSEKIATRRKIKIHHDSVFEAVEESIAKHAEYKFHKFFGEYPKWKKNEEQKEKKLWIGADIKYSPVDNNDDNFQDISSKFLKTEGIFAFDEGWQYPAITEKNAFEKIQELSCKFNGGVEYIGFPWATLIDKINNKAPDAHSYIELFEKFCEHLPKGTKKVTVCQHIYGKKYDYLFRQAGIEHIFWSHATLDDNNDVLSAGGPRFHPFPLYPVQVAEALYEASSESDKAARKYLYSFIGAKANQYYLTEARNWILEFLSDDSRGLVLGRNSWHYQKVVYDHQIKKAANDGQAENLVDKSNSSEFIESLKNSTFSLCPSGSGPNSIRLWESIGAGSIPVILADTWAPPGNRDLWDMAAVFCKEDPVAIKGLPDRLAKIASDPEKLSSMRHAMRQIWLLYGPQSFVTDVQEFMLSQLKYDNSSTNSLERSSEQLINIAVASRNLTSLLLHCASFLLLDPIRCLHRIKNDAQLSGALEVARNTEPKDSALLKHFDAVLGNATRKSKALLPISPAVICNVAPTIFLFGRHGNRTPLSYEPIQRIIGSRLKFVENPSHADVIVSGFNIDFRDGIDELIPLLKGSHKPKLAVISEEPLWDITWSGPFRGKEGKITAKEMEVEYTFLGHETSDIFDFSRIPYFILTSDSYLVRYANMIARFAKISPEEMCARWKKSSIFAAYYMEKRKGDAYSRSFSDRGIEALSAYRTSVAEYMQSREGVVCVGRGWTGDVRRQSLPDWHLDKLTNLDGKTRILSAYENVHQRNYITEKIFDAFAVGAVPIYWASSDHRISDLVNSSSFLNTYQLSPEDSAKKISDFMPDKIFAESWLKSAARLVSLFRDSSVVYSERLRVAQATIQSVISLV